MFKPGDVIYSAGDHIDNPSFPEYSKKAEIEMRLGSYDRTVQREKSLYVYTEIDTSELEWKTRSNGKRNLYKVRVQNEDILHTGDLMVYDAVIQDIRHGRDPTDNVEKYWAGCAAQKSAEYLVIKATVLEVLREASSWKSVHRLAQEKLRDEPDNIDWYDNPKLDD